MSTTSTDVKSYPINVSGIAPTTTKTDLHDFFSFCGTIHQIDHEEKGSTATVFFDKHPAAKTAVMLNGGTLDGAHLTVVDPAAHEEPHDEGEQSTGGAEFHQSDKPRAAIAAEYLAAGYKISDDMMQRGIDMDQKYGISSRFLSAFNSLDKGVGSRLLGQDQTVTGKLQSTVVAVTGSVTEKARGIDEQRGFSKMGAEYYGKYLSTWGDKFRDFYTKGAQQVTEIHAEAKRINEAQKAKTTSPSTDKPQTGDASAAAPAGDAPAAAAPLAP